MKRLKLPFSLLEVMIALSLTTVLISFLFYSFRTITIDNLEIQKLRQKAHTETACYLRLMQLFDTAELFSTCEHPKSNAKALSFFYENEIDIENTGNDCGELLLDKNGRFLLLTKNEREEIFFEKVKNINFSFYDPNKKKWAEKIPKNRDPSLLKIHIDDKTFSFILPKARRILK